MNSIMRTFLIPVAVCLLAGCSPKLTLNGGPLVLDDARESVTADYVMGPIQRLTAAPSPLLHFSLCIDRHSNAMVVWQDTSSPDGDSSKPLRPANLVTISSQGVISPTTSLTAPLLNDHPTVWSGPDGEPRIVQVTGNGTRQCRIVIYRPTTDLPVDSSPQLIQESAHSLDFWPSFDRFHTDWYHVDRLVTVADTGKVWAIGGFAVDMWKPLGFLGGHPVASYNRWFAMAFPDGPLHVVQDLPEESAHFDLIDVRTDILSFDRRGWAAAMNVRQHWGAWGGHPDDSRVILSIWDNHAWHSAVWSPDELVSPENREKLADGVPGGRNLVLADGRLLVFARDTCFTASLGDADGWGRLPLTWLSATRIGTHEAARTVAATEHAVLAVMATEKGTARCVVLLDGQWSDVQGATLTLERYATIYPAIRAKAAPDGTFHLAWTGPDNHLYHAMLSRVHLISP